MCERRGFQGLYALGPRRLTNQLLPVCWNCASRERNRAVTDGRMPDEQANSIGAVRPLARR